jgi:hypothetical protein
MEDNIQMHERLATLEAGVVYGNKRLDEICKKLDVNSCSLSDTTKDLVACETSLKTYKRLTWANLTILLTLAGKMLWPQ